MSSIKCPQCNLTNWADAPVCKRCGIDLRAEHVPGADWPGINAPQYNYSPQGFSPSNQYTANLKTGLAITSMVIGIIALVFCGLGILIAPVGFILSIVALVKANKKPHIYGGKGFAIAGITTSAISLLVVVPIIAAIAIPNLLAARKAAYESSAVKNLQTLASAQQAYFMASGSAHCADLVTLGSKQLIDSVLASGEKNGYRYTVTDLPARETACGIQATPTSKDGSRSFYLSTEDGVLRAATKNGRPADENDPPFKSNGEVGYR